MTTTTLRTIAGLNIQPLVRVSKASIASIILMILAMAFMTSNLSFIFFFGSLFCADAHIRWCEGRHNKIQSV